jgi:hypothetical protein
LAFNPTSHPSEGLARCGQKASDDLIKVGEGADPSVPFMEEFLDFVCEDKNIILSSKDWP